MRIMSFDVGIKNMAYCVFSISGEQLFSIEDWNVVNLMSNERPMSAPVCNCMISTKKGKIITEKPCLKKAKYTKNSKNWCEKHALQCSQYQLPKKEQSMVRLKKMKLEELRSTANELKLVLRDGMLKPDILRIVQTEIENISFHPIEENKTRKANEIDLIEIGRTMKIEFDKINNINNIDIVLIENQISPIANRMKTIQGMLAQYFIMINFNTKIEFVSSSHKLKQFVTIKTDTTKTDSYSTHKKDAVKYCSQLLEKNPSLNNWKESLNTKKKDDLSDCFLQGIWYIREKMENRVKIEI
jgi:hypothetical protein